MHDIDLYAGGMTEKRVPGTYVGKTFACILGKQFQNLKQGDRFWYERQQPEGFTEGIILVIYLIICLSFNTCVLRKVSRYHMCHRLTTFHYSPLIVHWSSDREILVLVVLNYSYLESDWLHQIWKLHSTGL